MAALGMCETPNCKSTAKLQCPTCVKLGIQGSLFCTQECFKSNWKSHKIIHSLAKGESADGKKNGFDPWPNYTYTGKLRPAPQTQKRTVPLSIMRPDYADHPSGFPISEQALKGTSQIKVLDDEEIEGMKVACKLGREVLDEAARVCGVGVTTDEIDRAVHEACIERDCYPSPLNYYEFPASCCTSVNEVICHGIPDLRVLQEWCKEGCVLAPFLFTVMFDFILCKSIPPSNRRIHIAPNLKLCDLEYADDAVVFDKSAKDFQEIVDRLHTNSSCVGLEINAKKTIVMHNIGCPDPDFPMTVLLILDNYGWEKLGFEDETKFHRDMDGDLCNVDVTVYHRGFHGDLNETFFVGNVSEEHKKLVSVTYECLSKAIDIVKPGEKYREIGNVIQKHAQANGFSVVRSYCGHGIHRLFHTAPSVPHYAKNKAVGVVQPGHCFTIEPMINAGGWRDMQWPDNWTAVTSDGSWSAQFEQTLLVNETGCEILTKRRTATGLPHFMDHMK